MRSIYDHDTPPPSALNFEHQRHTARFRDDEMRLFSSFRAAPRHEEYDNRERDQVVRVWCHTLLDVDPVGLDAANLRSSTTTATIS